MTQSITHQLLDLIEELFIENRAYRAVVDRLKDAEAINKAVAAKRADRGLRQRVQGLFLPLRSQSPAVSLEQMLRHLLLVLRAAEQRDLN